MTRPHVTDFYMDGYNTVTFCKLCSAEGIRLYDECQGPNAISTEQRIMERHLNLHPDMAETWPMDIIEKLIWIEKEKGFEGLMKEIRAMTHFPS